MSRQRKTKKQKLLSSQRKSSEGFKLKQEWLVNKGKATVIEAKLNNSEKRYFRQDLTKTFVLTMLVLALELALWHYLSRQ